MPLQNSFLQYPPISCQKNLAGFFILFFQMINGTSHPFFCQVVDATMTTNFIWISKLSFYLGLGYATMEASQFQTKNIRRLTEACVIISREES
jgi:hypothetical protein